MKFTQRLKTVPFCYPVMLIIVLIYFTFQQVNAQAPNKLRSTLSSGSTQGMVSPGKKPFPVQQSIGQMSVIGTYEAKGFLLRQGFIQPVYKKASATAENYEVNIAPNPFSAYITITPGNGQTEKLSVNIYNLSGKTVYSKQYNTSRELSIDLSSLANGLYIMKLTSAKKDYTTKLIKR